MLTLATFVGYNVEVGVALNCQRGPKEFLFSKEYKEEMVLKFKIPMMSIWYLCWLHLGDALSIRIENYVHVCHLRTNIPIYTNINQEKKKQIIHTNVEITYNLNYM